MRKTALLFLISTFLSAAFTSRAEGLEGRDSLLYLAACQERVVFLAENPREANDALILKASFYKEAGEYRDALSTLDRVRMFLVAPADRTSLIMEKAHCAYLAEDYDAAFSYLAEAGVACTYTEPKLKSEWAAMFLTLLVPAGYVYVGAPLEGLVSTALNAGSVAWIVTQVGSGLYFTGIFGGCLALSYTYLGAQQRVATLLQDRNSYSVTLAKRNALDALFRLHLREE